LTKLVWPIHLLSAVWSERCVPIERMRGKRKVM